MRPYKVTLVIIAVIILQVGLLPAWRPLGVVPDLLAAVIVALALTATASETLACAMIVGLTLDLASATDFGLHLGLYTVAALGVSLVNRLGIVLDSVAWRLGLSALIVLLVNLTLIATLIFHGANITFAQTAPIVAKSLILEIVVMLLVGPIMERLATPGETGTFGGGENG